MKKYRVGVVGTGFIGLTHIDSLRRLGNVEVVAIAEPYKPAEAAAKLFIPNYYTNYKDMIDDSSLELDAVHVCTPNNTHCEISLYALEHGMHVMCEKPMTGDLEQAKKMVEAEKSTKLHTGINFHNRFYPAINHLKHQIEDGFLGDIISVHGEYVQDWLLYKTDYNWRLVSKESGKTRSTADIGSHWMDTAEFLTGLKIVEVFAEYSTVYPNRKKPVGPTLSFRKADPDGLEGDYEDIPIDTEDVAMIMVRFDNGAKGVAMVSQMCAGKRNKLREVVSGTKASAEWDVEAGPTEIVFGFRDTENKLWTKSPNNVHPKAADKIDYPAQHGEGYPDAIKQVFKQFYHSIDDPSIETEYARFADGLHSYMLCEAIYKSAHEHRWVNINEIV